MTAKRKGDAWESNEAGERHPSEPAARLLDRVARGDLGALAELYESHSQAAYRLALRITGSTPDAQDVVQDLFIALPEALTSFRGDGSFRSWFRSCAARQALMHLRTRRRRREVELHPEWMVGSHGPGIERIELESALAQLPESLRVVVVLREIEGFLHEDIAEMLGITVAASRMRLMRARSRLREMVLPFEGPGG